MGTMRTEQEEKSTEAKWKVEGTQTQAQGRVLLLGLFSDEEIKACLHKE